MSGFRIPAALAALAALAASAGAPAWAADRSRGVAVQQNAGLGLAATLMLHDRATGDWRPARGGEPALQVGQRIAICLESAAAGYVSIWSRTDDGAAPVRVLPNDFTPEDRRNRGARVTAGERLCLGDDEGYRFTITPPTGMAEVYFHWTQSAEKQFGPEDMPVISDGGPSSRALSRAAPGYSARTLVYRVVE